MRIIAVFFIILGVALAGGAIHFGNQTIFSFFDMENDPQFRALNG